MGVEKTTSSIVNELIDTCKLLFYNNLLTEDYFNDCINIVKKLKGKNKFYRECAYLVFIMDFEKCGDDDNYCRYMWMCKNYDLNNCPIEDAFCHIKYNNKYNNFKMMFNHIKNNYDDVTKYNIEDALIKAIYSCEFEIAKLIPKTKEYFLNSISRLNMDHLTCIFYFDLDDRLQEIKNTITNANSKK